MRRLAVVGAILATLFMSGCSGSDEPEQQSNENKEVATATASPGDGSSVAPMQNPIPGFTYKSGGMCKGFKIYTQNQFNAQGGGYGARVRSDIDGQPLAEGIPGNVELIAAGWYDTGTTLPEPYASNPPGIQGQRWFYVPDADNGQGGWVADAGVRAAPTDRSPGNRSEDYDQETQAAPLPAECELTR